MIPPDNLLGMWSNGLLSVLIIDPPHSPIVLECGLDVVDRELETGFFGDLDNAVQIGCLAKRTDFVSE